MQRCHVPPSFLLALPPTHHPSPSSTYPLERGDLLCQQVCLSVVILHEHIPRLLCVVIRVAPSPAPTPAPAPLCVTRSVVWCVEREDGWSEERGTRDDEDEECEFGPDTPVPTHGGRQRATAITYIHDMNTRQSRARRRNRCRAKGGEPRHQARWNRVRGTRR